MSGAPTPAGCSATCTLSFSQTWVLTFFKSGSRHAVTHVLKVTWDKAMGQGVRAQDLGPDGSHS